jgi:hypothetical protein
VRGVGTIMSHKAFPKQRFVTTSWDMQGSRQSWQRFLKQCDAAHDRDGLHGMLRLLMSVSPIFLLLLTKGRALGPLSVRG